MGQASSGEPEGLKNPREAGPGPSCNRRCDLPGSQSGWGGVSPIQSTKELVRDQATAPQSQASLIHSRYTQCHSCWSDLPIVMGPEPVPCPQSPLLWGSGDPYDSRWGKCGCHRQGGNCSSRETNSNSTAQKTNQWAESRGVRSRGLSGESFWRQEESDRHVTRVVQQDARALKS